MALTLADCVDHGSRTTTLPVPAAKPLPSFDHYSQSHSPLAYTNSLSGKQGDITQGWRNVRRSLQKSRVNFTSLEHKVPADSMLMSYDLLSFPQLRRTPH